MVLIASGTATSVAANSTSANLISNEAFRLTGAGIYTLICKPSATGMSSSFKHGGFPVCDAQSVPWFGTTGTMSMKDNVLFQVKLTGGVSANDLRFINTTAGALTVDYLLYYD